MSECTFCPNTTFNHPLGAKYVSYGVTFAKGITGTQACVPKYSQLPNPAGHRLVLPDAMFTNNQNYTGNVDAAITSCVEACPAGQCCVAELEKVDDVYVCKRAQLAVTFSLTTGSATDKARMYYKLPPSEIAAASVNTSTAKTIASGIFAVCDVSAFASDVEGGFIGTSTDPTKVEQDRTSIEWNGAKCNSEASCQQACIADATCWGVVYHPVKGFAMRGGEDRLDTRTFFSSPDATISSLDMESYKWAEAKPAGGSP